MIFNVDMWNEMDRLRREMNSLFTGYDRASASTTYPLVNVYDDKDAVIVTAELPGMAKEQVQITYADGSLTLSGNLEPLSSTKKMTIVRQERSAGAFEKSLRIPTKIDQEKINASFSNGILTVTLPKAEEAKPKTIHIDVK
jgi:HSP20 family protein